jgi:hypothetical protein
MIDFNDSHRKCIDIEMIEPGFQTVAVKLLTISITFLTIDEREMVIVFKDSHLRKQYAPIVSILSFKFIEVKFLQF